MEGGIEVEINDPRNVQIETTKIRLKSQTESNDTIKKPDFSFFMSPGTTGSATAFAPKGVKSVTIAVTEQCFVGSIIGEINCGGTIIKFNATGFSGVSTTIRLPSSNTNVKIECGTPCTTGGYFTANFNY